MDRSISWEFIGRVNPMKRSRLSLAVSALLSMILVLAGCSAAATPPPAEPPPAATVAEQATAATITPLPEPTATLEPTATAEPEPTQEPAATPTLAEPTATATPVLPTATPVPELSLAEALAAAFTAAPTAAGEVILVTGQVLDLSGNPLPGAAVEFWQTDAAGIYDHPGDRSTANRDRGFQFYGTSIADADGRYVFRTLQPGYYEPRPRHIHVKVKLDGRTLLTTQFYFYEDQANLSGEGLFSQAGSLGDMLMLDEVDWVEMGGVLVAVLGNDLIVNTGAAGPLTATPAQGEGPYYPVVSVADFDNDLAAVP
jgi:protocatechuate 3,4-dioxygenase, beta subunit